MGQSHSRSNHHHNKHKHEKDNLKKNKNNIFGRNYPNNKISKSDKVALELERKNFSYIESFSLQSTFEALCKIDENGVGYIDKETFVVNSCWSFFSFSSFLVLN